VSSPHPALAGKSCLVLDDELLIALDIEQILLAAGATSVACFASAEDALAALRGGARIDIAVLDVLLHGARQTALGVAAALQLQKTPFVFLTGVRGDDLGLDAFSAVPIVEKPYRPALLIDAVVRALSTR